MSPDHPVEMGPKEQLEKTETMDLMENRDCLDLLETEESLEKMGLLEFKDYLETRVPLEAKVLQDYKDTKALPENKEIQ